VSVSVNGWNGPRSAFSGGAALLGLAVAGAAVMFLMLLLSGEGPRQLVAGGWIAAGVGGVALLLVLIKLAQDQPTLLKRGPAFLVAAVGCVGVISGGVLTGLFAARFVAAASAGDRPIAGNLASAARAAARSPLVPPPPG
jgi:hypothetical protein